MKYQNVPEESDFTVESILPKCKITGNIKENKESCLKSIVEANTQRKMMV